MTGRYGSPQISRCVQVCIATSVFLSASEWISRNEGKDETRAFFVTTLIDILKEVIVVALLAW